MKKREWFIVILPLLLTWSVDRITKHWANALTEIKSFGPINIVLHHNPGAMLGLFSDLPSILRIVSLSTGGAFLLCIYALIQYLLPIRSLTLRTGLSTLIGGIIGNVTDRIIWGYVVDFIAIGNFNMSTPAFNLADALQWVGYALIVIAIVREGNVLWPENDIRKNYWVNKQFQLKYSFVLMGVGLSLTVISAVFSYTYLKSSITELVGNNQFLIGKFVNPFIVTYVIISVGFCTILFAIGKIISHRIAGPLYAFERYLEKALSGDAKILKLRAGDEFKHLEDLAIKIQVELQKIRAERTVNVVEFQEEKTKKTSGE